MEDDGYCVRLRGLPWSATQDDVYSFFNGCQLRGGKAGIYLTLSKEGRPSGHAFVEFMSEDDVQRALKKNKEHLGNRYIEVFRCKKSEMDWVVKRGGMDNNSLADAIVKLRGLPFGCSKEEIAQFFTGLEIVPNGIMLPEDRLGRSTGEAFVQFASPGIAERALGKHKERIGHRYIEVFKSNLNECRAIFGNEQFGMRGPMGMGMGMGMGRPGPYDRNDRFGAPMNMGPMAAPMGPFAGRGRGRGNVKGFYENDYDMYSMGFAGQAGRGRGGGRGPPGSHYISKTGHSVHMRGMPFLAIEEDVLDFFSPLKPVSVQFEYGEDGRRTGGADVDFASHQEAMEAMKKHRCNMQYRYIELFLNSSPNPQGGGGGGGGYAGDMNCMSGAGAKFAGNMGGGFSMGGGAGFGSGNFGSMQGQQFSSSSNGYGMGGGNMGAGNMAGGNMGVGSMGAGSGYGGGSGMNSTFMEGGGYNRMGGW